MLTFPNANSSPLVNSLMGYIIRHGAPLEAQKNYGKDNLITYSSTLLQSRRGSPSPVLMKLCVRKGLLSRVETRAYNASLYATNPQ